MSIDKTSLSLLDRLSQSQDQDDWNRLVEFYTPLLRKWILQYYVQEADTEDLIQEVLTTVLREIPSFQHNQRTGAFRNWLRTILVHRLRNFWRQRKYQAKGQDDTDLKKELDQLADDQSSVSKIWDRDHDQEILNRALTSIQSRVDPTTWKAFQLQWFQGLSTPQITAELKLSADSIYAAKSRILNMLRKETQGLLQVKSKT